MQFIKSRSLAVKKDHEERLANYKKACTDAKDWDEASVIAQTSIYGELITLNETMAACADYLGTIANILNSSNKGGK